MSKPKVYCTKKFLPEPMSRANEAFDLTLNDTNKNMTCDEILAAADGMEGFLIFSDDFSANTINQLPDSVKFIATVSVGFDHIDVDACRARGIRVSNTPGVLVDATADTTWLCLLGAAKLAQHSYNNLRTGKWQGNDLEDILGWDIHNKRLGIIGMGDIGRVIAKRASAWDMEIHYHNRNRLPAELENGATYHEDVESLFKVSDILSINCPATPETINILNEETIDLLPDNAIVVNSSRGATINDDALISALQSGKVFAAGLDVFDGEPNFDKRYLDLKNVFLLPHIGSATWQTRNAMGNLAVDNLIAVFNGEDMITEIT